MIELISENMKVLRSAENYTQDKMAEVIGISKKTLVQIEKGRSEASWTVVVAVCALFRDSVLLQSILGPDPVETVALAARDHIRTPKNKTLGGRIFWQEVEQRSGFRLQQNIISKHFRILDAKDYRLFSTIDQDVARKELKQIAEQMEPNK